MRAPTRRASSCSTAVATSPRMKRSRSPGAPPRLRNATSSRGSCTWPSPGISPNGATGSAANASSRRPRAASGRSLLAIAELDVADLLRQVGEARIVLPRPAAGDGHPSPRKSRARLTPTLSHQKRSKKSSRPTVDQDGSADDADDRVVVAQPARRAHHPAEADSDEQERHREPERVDARAGAHRSRPCSCSRRAARIEPSTGPTQGAAHTANAPPRRAREPVPCALSSSPGAARRSRNGSGNSPMNAKPQHDDHEAGDLRAPAADRRPALRRLRSASRARRTRP